MSTLLLSPVGHEALSARRNLGLIVVIVGIVGSVAIVSAWDAVRRAGQATRAPSVLPVGNAWTEARITKLDPRSMQLTTRDGRTEELALDFEYTSVFQKGSVLSIAHLRMGQQMQVLSSRRAGGQAIAKAIELTTLHPPRIVD